MRTLTINKSKEQIDYITHEQIEKVLTVHECNLVFVEMLGQTFSEEGYYYYDVAKALKRSNINDVEVVY